MLTQPRPEYIPPPEDPVALAALMAQTSPPDASFFSAYRFDNPDYAESFQIDAPDHFRRPGEFLGECGAGIAQPRAGKRKRQPASQPVHAIEAWLFDKDSAALLPAVFVTPEVANGDMTLNLPDVPASSRYPAAVGTEIVLDMTRYAVVVRVENVTYTGSGQFAMLALEFRVYFYDEIKSDAARAKAQAAQPDGNANRRLLLLFGAVVLLVLAGLGLLLYGMASRVDLPDPAQLVFMPGDVNRGWTPVIQTLDYLPDSSVPFAYVPGGCFLLGNTDTTDEARAHEWPAVEVCLNAFWISQAEVTNAQYAACVFAEACTRPAEASDFDNPAMAAHPVRNVNWFQARAYALWLGGDLPTEAQWDYAARGPEGVRFPWGSTFDPLMYNGVGSDDGVGFTAPVGSFPQDASWVGALDMAGNLQEWVRDWYDSAAYAALAAGARNPAGPDTGFDRVVRGGSWRNGTRFSAELSTRRGYMPEYVDTSLGFRVMVPVG